MVGLRSGDREGAGGSPSSAGENKDDRMTPVFFFG
jgi:hypothetical protein